ncbi:hypothetical protein FA15DRAFT_674209 [Coprinopsis marcescibilis]|uniref:UBX domain-containing protein n=1 Tax=Coprinopsis marcescibilis TaxID=230819 RepID=A0A5C3KIJ0_COPMA|nr:hypothetical protein FA15DRAFT_674209 [Coprinopsis marcescibilis]
MASTVTSSSSSSVPPSGEAASPPVAATSESSALPADFKVYAPTVIAAQPLPSLSDDYFTPSSSELKVAQATLAARTSNLVNAPLQVRARREEAAKVKRDRWPTTTIRIRFSDRMQLEKVFPSTDKIRSVYAFVRGCLRDDVKPIKFILYQSPPKRDLKVSDPLVRDLTLYDLQLAPASVLLLRFEDESLNGTTVPAPLLQEIIGQAVELPVPKPAEPQVQAEPAKHGPLQSSAAKPSGSSGEKKIPKWMKLGKK